MDPGFLCAVIGRVPEISLNGLLSMRPDRYSLLILLLSLVWNPGHGASAQAVAKGGDHTISLGRVMPNQNVAETVTFENHTDQPSKSEIFN